MTYITRADIEFLPKQGFFVKKTNACYNAPGFSAIYRHNEPDWTKNYDSNKLKQATDRGISFDSCIQAYYNAKICQLDCKNLLKSAEPLIELISPIEQEIFVFGKIRQLPMLGFIDALIDMKNDRLNQLTRTKTSDKFVKGLTILDWKTKSSSNYNPAPLSKYILQISVYARLAKIFYGIDIEQGCVALAFANGEPCQMLWINKQTMADSICAFAGKIHKYKSNVDINWRGEYSLSYQL